jgi:hypothetical protein
MAFLLFLLFSIPRISFSFFFFLMHLYDAETFELVCRPAGVKTNLISVLAISFAEIYGNFIENLPTIFMFMYIV